MVGGSESGCSGPVRCRSERLTLGYTEANRKGNDSVARLRVCWRRLFGSALHRDHLADVLTTTSLLQDLVAVSAQ